LVVRRRISAAEAESGCTTVDVVLHLTGGLANRAHHYAWLAREGLVEFHGNETAGGRVVTAVHVNSTRSIRTANVCASAVA